MTPFTAVSQGAVFVSLFAITAVQVVITFHLFLPFPISTVHSSSLFRLM